LPTNKRHIKVPKDRLLCPTHINNKKKQVFEKFLIKCVTRPDLSGVPLNLNFHYNFLNIYERIALHTFVIIIYKGFRILKIHVCFPKSQRTKNFFLTRSGVSGIASHVIGHHQDNVTKIKVFRVKIMVLTLNDCISIITI